MRPAASLLVYNPLEWFRGPDERYWRQYVEAYRQVGARHRPEFEARFTASVGLRGDNDVIHAFVRERRGRVLLCPAYGKVGIDDIIPEIVAALPDALREKALRLARRTRITHLYHRRADPTRLPAAYHPITFFLLFIRSERRVRLRPAGRSGEGGYVTGLRRARGRLERLRRAASRSGEPAHVMQEIDAIREFLGLHHEEALLEMRFLRPEGQPDPRSEDPVVQEMRERIRSSDKGVLFPGGVLSGVRADT